MIVLEMKKVKNKIGQLLTNQPESKQSKEAVNFCRKLYTVSVEKISEMLSVAFKHGVESFVDNIRIFAVHPSINAKYECLFLANNLYDAISAENLRNI